jgi:hypothetical protein
MARGWLAILPAPAPAPAAAPAAEATDSLRPRLPGRIAHADRARNGQKLGEPCGPESYLLALAADLHPNSSVRSYWSSLIVLYPREPQMRPALTRHESQVLSRPRQETE